jgi:hypothetical protein
MQRFVDDDAGYVAWLEAHPRGYVLNTFSHMSSSYLVLHRATCGTVNRPLAKGREWTHQYGKACSDDHAELAEWALRETGKSVHGCGTCGPPVAPAVDVVIPVGALAARAHGPRTPRADDREVRHDGEPVRIVIGRTTRGAGRTGPPLVIEGAQWLAELFFRRDPSAVGATSYDTWIEATQHDPERRARIIDEDITAVNRTMAARTSHEAWAPIITGNDWAWLAALDPDWDLLDLDPAVWEEAGVAALLRRAFEAIHRPGLGIAVTTKVLHIKRPGLVPVLDSLVIAQIGGRVDDDPTSWVDAIEHIRAVGRANLPQLRLIREHLRRVGLLDRTLLRVLDALLWTSSPGSNLFSSLDGWERVVRLRGPNDPVG